jgi:selenocysteine lyase/cysteine desulfurase
MKWLLGPPGIGFLHLSPRLLADAPLLDIGYLGLDAPLGEWPPDAMPPSVPDARRYELGLPSLPGVFAARAGIELLLAVGIDRIHAHVERLASRCIDGLEERGGDVITPREPVARAGVIAARHPDIQRVFAVCRARRVDIGAIGSLRIDPHGFNTDDDVDRFLAAYDAA